VQFVHDSVGTDAIVERFIDGREFYVGVLGNDRLQVLPVWEMLFTKMAPDAWRIATDRVKSNSAYQKKHGIKTAEAQDLPPGESWPTGRTLRNRRRAPVSPTRRWCSASSTLACSGVRSGADSALTAAVASH
jgi:D-alanine-D-alanine ligase